VVDVKIHLPTECRTVTRGEPISDIDDAEYCDGKPAITGHNATRALNGDIQAGRAGVKPSGQDAVSTSWMLLAQSPVRNGQAINGSGRGGGLKGRSEADERVLRYRLPFEAPKKNTLVFAESGATLRVF